MSDCKIALAMFLIISPGAGQLTLAFFGGQLFFIHFSIALGLYFEKPSDGVIVFEAYWNVSCFGDNQS